MVWVELVEGQMLTSFLSHPVYFWLRVADLSFFLSQHIEHTVIVNSVPFVVASKQLLCVFYLLGIGIRGG